jgi:hypothetical protein
LIERAYRVGEQVGLAVWTQDEAGPSQAIPPPGPSWQPAGQPARVPHEYVRGGTAKLLTLFRPATGAVRAQPVLGAPNAVLHPWLRHEVAALLADLPELPADVAAVRASHAFWAVWQAGLATPVALPDAPEALPPLRALLVWDTLAGHKTPAVVAWLVGHGVLPLYPPLGGSWLGDPLGDGGVGAAQPRPAGARRPAPSERPAGHRLAGRHGPRLERHPHPVRLGWETATAPLARPPAAACAGRRRCRHASSSPAPRATTVSLRTSVRMTSDPLVGHAAND